jgi:hypothetical protein
MDLDEKSARAFRLELQAARENAIKDAEAFDGIIHIIERLGIFLFEKIGDLGKYGPYLKKLAAHSPLASRMPREWHTPFDLLYDMVTHARNDALHIGAFARHLTTHAIELALVLEDALRTIENAMSQKVSDFMIRNPVCAHLWQPVSFIRQTILTNSFSYLPVQNEDKVWCLVSDLLIARYLQQAERDKARKKALARPLGATGIKFLEAKLICQGMTIDELFGQAALCEQIESKPLLVRRDDTLDELAGILTPFDLI